MLSIYFRVTVFCSVMMLASCTTIRREAGYPGGNLGYASDRKILFAQGHEQRVQRDLVILTLLAPLVAETATTPLEARLSAERIRATYANLNILKTAAGKCAISRGKITKDNSLGLTLASCDIPVDKLTKDPLSETALTFETVSFEVAKSLNNTLKQAYDNLNLRLRVNSVTALSPSDILKTVLQARHLLPIAMKYFATYRDVTSILSASVVQSCNDGQVAYNNLPPPVDRDEKPKNWKYKAVCGEMGDELTNYLGRSRTADNSLASEEVPIRKVYDASRKAINLGLNWRFDEKHAAALIYHIDRTCAKLEKLQEIEFKKEEVTKCQLKETPQAGKFLKQFEL
nr:hypothetical protein [Amylibacter sp.]